MKNAKWLKLFGGAKAYKRISIKGFKGCPVETGKEYEVDITETSLQGEGVARIQGFVIYVANAKPGDRVRIKITRIGVKNAYAEIVR